MTRTTKLPIWSLFNQSEQAMLKTPSQPVDLSTLETPEMQQLIDDMVITMNQAEGIGLAAPQVGKSLRLAVVTGEVNGQSEPYVLVNPIISPIGAEQVDGEEGCLSIRDVFGLVPRATHIRLKAFDRHGQPWSIEAFDLFARVIQHEVDHLQGVLFLDRVTRFTKGQDKLK